MQFTPPGSEASIIFGRGITSKKPGSADGLTLVVDDVDAARKDLVARGIAVSEVFHYAGGPFNSSTQNPRVDGRDPEGRSYFLLPLSKTRMVTAGCYRKSQPAFLAANGRRRQHEPQT